MNDAAVLPHSSSRERPEIQQVGAGRALPWVGFLVLACFAAPAAMFFSQHKPLSEIWPLVLATATVLVPLAACLAVWRRSWLHRLKTAEQQCRVKTAESAVWQSQLADRRRTEEVLEESLVKVREELAGHSERRAALQAELDARKRTEKSLSEQRLVLQSSKTVLEMHVEARNQELQNLQHRYELILNSAGEGICGLDRHGKAAFVNPAVAKITGWPIEQLIGKTEREIFYPKGSSAPPEAVASSSGERFFYRKDGTFFPVEFVRTNIEEEGRQTGAVVIFKDITERKRTEETLSQKAAELGRSNAELEQFAFVASHDLQEPLRKIQAFGDRLKAKLDDSLPPDASEYLARMQNASARMRTLIDDLLAFSRVIRSAEPFVPVDLGQIAKEVLGDLEVRIEKNAARVEVGDLPTIDADATQMRQLLLNLIGNALKFQAPGAQPLVKVNARKFRSLSGEQFCELTVQDNGIGFEEQYAEKIFVVFQRLHGRGEYEGTGVGLAVCRRITDRHQGTIVAKSQPGEGTTFLVTLPVQQTKPKAAQ